jgi:hypothetical protein
MTNERAWPVKAMYVLVAAALAISLIIMAAPAQKVSASPGLSEWTRVDTPTTDGWVLSPCSTIVDYALAEGGEVAYAIIYQDKVQCPEPCPNGEQNGGEEHGPWYLLKSDDYGATWDDITDAVDDVIDPDDEDKNYIEELVLVATDWVDPDFVAVAVWWWDNDAPAGYHLDVLFSTDGGDTFEDTGEVEDGGVYFDDPYDVSDLAVSPEAAGKREIAIGGQICHRV